MEPFKNLLGIEAAQMIAKSLKKADPNFPTMEFLKDLRKKLDPLELKDRSRFLTQRLLETWTHPHRSSFILSSLQKVKDIEGFALMPVADLIPRLLHPLSECSMSLLTDGLETLEHLTEMFSAEFAVRPFLIHREKETLQFLHSRKNHSNEHIRRWASEGSRPLLPWGERIPSIVKNPEVTRELLEHLLLDPSLYVRKSVANHLNDHSKNHGAWLIEFFRNQEKKQKNIASNPHYQWLKKHALRTLIKNGDPNALQLIGVKSVALKVDEMNVLTPKVKLGGKFEVKFTISNPLKETVQVMIDHEFHFLKSNGKHSKKVFKGSHFTLDAKSKQNIHLKVPLRPVTTRKYYSGVQHWNLLVNGIKGKTIDFSLIVN